MTTRRSRLWSRSLLLPCLFAFLGSALGAPAVAQEETTIVGTVAATAKPEGILLAPSPELAEVFDQNAPQSIEDLRAIEDHVTALAAKLEPCVVGVRIGNAQGSGVIVSKDGFVLTAAHVSGKPGRKATLILPDGREVPAKTLGANRGIDAGMIRITTDEEWPFAEMADFDNVEAGDWTVAIGHPGGYKKGRRPVVRLGRIIVKRNSVIQTDNALVGGDSGGPLFDTSGRVVGIHSRIGPSITWNFHVPISAYSDDWERLAEAEEWGGGKAPSPTVLGVNGEDHEDGGALVTGTPEGFPAQRAGIQNGDVIVKVDEEEIKKFSDLSGYVGKLDPGDEIHVVVRRGTKTLEFDVVLADRNETR